MIIPAHRTAPAKLAAFVLLFSLVCPFVPAELAAQDATPELLPQDPAAWIGSRPLSNHLLEGKVTVLYFFDPTVALANDLWPQLNQVKSDLNDQPVFFVGIVPTTRPHMLAYIQKHQSSWPLIVDPERTLEKKFELPRIEPTHAWHGLMIMPDGSREECRPNDLRPALTSALKKAKWRLDPLRVPTKFHSAWQAIEAGNYPAADWILKKRTSKDRAESLASVYLTKAVREDLAQAIRRANEVEAKDEWLAYKRLHWISDQYGEFVDSKKLGAKIKKLASNKNVAKQLEARKLLWNAQAALAGSATTAGRGKRLLRQVIEDYPNTEASHEALEFQKALSEQEQGPFRQANWPRR